MSGPVKSVSLPPFGSNDFDSNPKRHTPLSHMNGKSDFVAKCNATSSGHAPMASTSTKSRGPARGVGADAIAFAAEVIHKALIPNATCSNAKATATSMLV